MNSGDFESLFDEVATGAVTNIADKAKAMSTTRRGEVSAQML
jgi:hypothetical protein